MKIERRLAAIEDEAAQRRRLEAESGGAAEQILLKLAAIRARLESMSGFCEDSAEETATRIRELLAERVAHNKRN